MPGDLTFERLSRMPASAGDLYAWHARAGALERLLPPWRRVEVLERRGSIRDGDRTTLRVRLAPLLWRTWIAVHRDHVEGRRFRDVQERGPFARFDHLHLFEEAGPGESVLHDLIAYRPPGGALGRLLLARPLRRELERQFAYRHRVTAGDLAAHGDHAAQPRLRVLVGGAAGRLGRALCAFLETGGHAVLRLVPGGARCAGEVGWETALAPASAAWPSPDAVILLGDEEERVGGGSRRRRGRERSARLAATRRLAQGLALQARPPGVLVHASSTAVYGGRGGEILNEASALGSGPEAERLREAEQAAGAAREAGLRVVTLRFGALLAPSGGDLAPLSAALMWGPRGAARGDAGWLPWLALDDALDIALRALCDARLDGPVNAVAPEQATVAAFASTWRQALGRPGWLPLPGWAGRAWRSRRPGGGGPGGQRVEPAALMRLGHRYRFPGLSGALRHALGRTA